MRTGEKILLLLLPFWPPLIPPLGITSIKTFIQQYGYRVKIDDANVRSDLGEVVHLYFDKLKELVTEQKSGNFYNVGHDVWENHTMAHLHHTDKKEYVELVKILVFKTFFVSLQEWQVLELNNILNTFFTCLEKYISGLLDKEKPTVVGVSVFSGTLAASMFTLKLAKEKYPDIRTVMGGGTFSDYLAAGSPDMDFFLEKAPYIDKIIRGEGEILFLKFLQGEFPESQKILSLADIKGETLDLSFMPVLDFSDLEMKYYPYISASISRSCPFQCKFCAETVIWEKYRKKEAKQVGNELISLHKLHGTQLFLMCDSLLNPVINDLANELLESEPVVYWDGYLRADQYSFDIENTLRWGARRVLPGQVWHRKRFAARIGCNE